MYLSTRLAAAAALTAVAWLCAPSLALAQSTAINANIEGTVRDASGAVLPGATVTVINADTGFTQTVITDADGYYRAALLPLGSYRVRAELTGFKTIDQTGITLSAGQTARVNATLAVGSIAETVEVSADSPVTEPLKVDLGRTINETDIQNLPNIARNTFNFALLQPNVTGFENEEFGATRMNANGSQMRTNYQIDGSSATQKNRAGLRMFQPSEVMVREVKVITSGFAPEFGQTTGMVYNAVTPSGTNAFNGSGSYRFRRSGFAARPILLSPTAPKPDLKVDDVTAAIGGPIRKNRAFFYTGYERLVNDLSAGRVITVSPADAALLGLSPEALGDGVIPAVQTVDMFIGKADVVLTPGHRFSGRWSLFKNSTPENVGGGLNTRETATDFEDRMDSYQAQLISTLGNSHLNELRIAYGRRNNPRVPSAVAGPGPAVTITGVANFGGSDTRTDFVEDYWQIVDNWTWFRGRHSLKAGLDVQFVHDERLSNVAGSYTFPDRASYLAARSGLNPFGYTRFDQSVGDPTVAYDQTYYSFFVQDDFQWTPRFKLLYGLRYDAFKVPDGDPDAPHPWTREFRVDGNNIAPRAGFSWSVDDEARTVVRASTGIMYEPPLGMFYEDALLESGAPRLLTASLSPSQPGAPAYPDTLANLPPDVTPSRSIRVVNPDFDTQWALLSNLQVERALNAEMSVAVAYVNSTGRDLPVVLNSNVVATGETLPDGRPIYAAAVSPATRVFPDFDVINEVRSTGNSDYNALTLSWTKRMADGWQANAFYTLARAEEDAVLGGRYVVGSSDRPGLSDPSNQDLDYGPTAWDVRHSFALSAVVAPQVDGDGLGAALMRDNQVSLVLQANSGLPFNIRSNRDLNRDGITADRPNDIGRNSESLPGSVTFDFRYSRYVPLHGDMRLEAFVEAKNLFNRANVRGVNSVVGTDVLGNPLVAVPTGVCDVGDTAPSCFAVTSVAQERQMQLGIKFIF